jgi:hypothetical protein
LAAIIYCLVVLHDFVPIIVFAIGLIVFQWSSGVESKSAKSVYDLIDEE